MTPYEAEKLLKNDGWYEVGLAANRKEYV